MSFTEQTPTARALSEHGHLPNGETSQWYEEYARLCAEKMEEFDRELRNLEKMREPSAAEMEFLGDIIAHLDEMKKEALLKVELYRLSDNSGVRTHG